MSQPLNSTGAMNAVRHISDALIHFVANALDTSSSGVTFRREVHMQVLGVVKSLCAICAVVGIANAASGAVLLEYDASAGSLPTDVGWTRSGLAMTLSGNKLVQHATTGGVTGGSNGEYLSPSLASGTFTLGGAAYGIEFRVQPQGDLAFVGNAWPRMYLTWSDNVNNYNVSLDKFTESATSGVGDVVYGRNSFSKAINNIDWSQPHTVFIGHRASGASSVFDFYLDGVLRSTVVEGSIARSGSYARDAIGFGDGTSASASVTGDWYFIRVYDTNTPPVPEPGVTSLLGITIGGLLAARRRRA